MRTVENTLTNDDVDDYRIEAKNAAKELWYGPEVIDKIEHAETIREIQRIMVNARYEKFGK